MSSQLFSSDAQWHPMADLRIFHLHKASYADVMRERDSLRPGTPGTGLHDLSGMGWKDTNFPMKF